MNLLPLQDYLHDPVPDAPALLSVMDTLVQRHPWFGAGHFLAAVYRSQQADGTPAAPGMQKALVYFNNPLWFRYQWERFREGNARPELQSVHLDVTLLSGNNAGITASGIPEQAKEEETVIAATVEEQMPDPDFRMQDLQDAAADAAALVEADEDRTRLEEWQAGDSFPLQDLVDAAADAVALVEAEDELDLQQQQGTEPEASIAATESDQPVVADEAAVDTILPAETTPALPVGPTAPETPAPVQELAFEPFHTVDYFASQGIRLQEEKLGNDDLSKQVKTFTQWLRSMKKIYHDAPTPLDAVSETEVNRIADVSNHPEEILTETMAQVLIQQGKTVKAIELYGKLILLHPEKSAYFADQIQKINSQS
ncbi:MAG TPA: hypothetical protein PKE07_03820 [Lacibacter sp.]|nr:hypothetical protein [Lacibacter sp.]HMO89751.1 hypothetical protein [Lacibacter sp.]